MPVNRKTVQSFTNVVDIARVVADVFDYVADLENVPAWNYAIGSTRKVSSGPVGVGAVYAQHRVVPRPADERLEITAFDPGRRIVVEGVLGPFPAELEYDFEPTAIGTRLTNTVHLTMNGPLRLVAGPAAGQVRKAVAENLDVLKRLLESTA